MAASDASFFEKFPALEVYRKAPVLGLLFSAGWCPDCWRTVPRLGKIVEDEKSALLEVVYISSDSSADEMKNFCPSSFASVAFEETELRSGLKKHFSTCARKEQASLGISDRQHGTPTLILLESATGRVLHVDDGLGELPDADDKTKTGAMFDSWRSKLS